VNNKKSIIDRLESLKVESGLSDKVFKDILASITGKTPRTIRRWYSLESNIHENDIDRISKYFGKHVHWLRYGEHSHASTAIDQIMYSNHFGAVIIKDDKAEEVNFKFIEMMNLSENDIRRQDICDYILQFQPEETVTKCKQGNDEAINNGAFIDQMKMILGDGKMHHIESTTLNLNHGRILRILFDKGLVDTEEPTELRQKISGSSQDNNAERKQLRILFVDDDIANCQLYNSMLSIHNCEVKTFNCSLHALNEFKQNHQSYDLLISDIIMPDMTGDKLALECRQINPSIPVILCSGYADHLNKSTAEEFGVSHYLQKPIDSTELLSLINRLR